jgi:TusA-related sulfurtransferase
VKVKDDLVDEENVVLNEKTMTGRYQNEVKILDCCGVQCPGPIMKVHEAIVSMKESEVLKVSATDMGFASDIGAWCRRTGNTLLNVERKDKENIV